MFTPWLRLPIELKIRVLEYAVHAGEPVDYKRHCRDLKRKRCLGAFIGTRNNEIVQLSIKCYYRINTFHLILETLPHGWSVAFSLRHPQREYARMIRHLSFTAYCLFPTVNTKLVFFDATWAWTFVFTAEDGLDAPTPGSIDFLDKAFISKRAELWHDFSNLETFEASLTIFRRLTPANVRDALLNPGIVGPTSSECFCNNHSRIEKVLSHSRLGFKAKKCSFTLKAPKCVSGECNNRLAAVLEAAISTQV